MTAMKKEIILTRRT